MAELTGKAISELTRWQTLPNNALIPISDSGQSACIRGEVIHTAISTAVKKAIRIVDSDIIQITASSNTNSIGTVSFDIPKEATIISYTLITTNVSGSWNFQVSYYSATKTVSFYNYGTQSNTWTGYVRVAYML